MSNNLWDDLNLYHILTFIYQLYQKKENISIKYYKD